MPSKLTPTLPAIISAVAGQAPVAGEAKYLRLANMLRRQMETGVLQPGDRLPSFSEMCSEFGVTNTTVERVHSVLLMEGLIVKLNGKGTFVAPKRRSTGCLGFFSELVWSHHANSPYWAHLMNGVHEAAHEAGFEILMMNPRAETSSWHRVDGVLTTMAEATPFATLPASCPRVCLLSQNRAASWVAANEMGGMELAVHHLVEWGHRRIGFLVAETGPSYHVRLAGYQKGLAECGIQGEAAWIRPLALSPGHGDFQALGQMRMTEWLADDWRATGCTALICQNDETAVGVMRAVQAQNIRVPDELSVVGFDGTEMCEWAYPALTSVAVPLHEIGKTGVRILLEEIGGRSRGKTGAILETRLRVGGSTGRLSP